MRNIINDYVSLFLLATIFLTIGYILFAFKTGEFEKHKSSVYSVDINNRHTIVSASENELLLWEKTRCTNRLIGHTNTIKSVAFSHDGNLFASGSIDKSIKIWSLSEKKVIQTLNRHTKGVNKVKFSISGNYVISAGYDDKLFIWDWKNDKIIEEFNVRHTEFSISKSDVLAYIDPSCNLKLFDLNSMKEITAIEDCCGVPQFHPNKNIIALKLNNGNFNFIDIDKKSILSELKTHHGNDFYVFKFTPDGKFLISGISGGDIEIWDWQQGEVVEYLQGHKLGSITDLAFSKENELLSASNDRTIKIWDLENGRLKTVVSDGVFQAKLTVFLAFIILLTLISSFLGILQTSENKYSSFAIISILSVWSLGILLMLYYAKSTWVKYATPLSWTATIFSGLFLLSVYGILLSFLIIPIGLFFGYIQLISDRQNEGAYTPIVINLIFYGIICLLALSSIE